MELTSQVINEAEFVISKKGYDADQVDEFLEKVAVAVDQQAAALVEARGRAEAAETRAVAAEERAEAAEGRLRESPIVGQATASMAVVQPSADGAAQAEAEARAQEMAETTERELKTLQRTLLQAQKTADATVRDAQLEARAMITAAEQEARSAHEATRNRVLEEISRHDGRREVLRGEVVALERHLEEQRVKLRGSIASLQRILDDAARLKAVSAPPPTHDDATAPIAPSNEGKAAPRSAAPVPQSSGFVVAEDIADDDSWLSDDQEPEALAWPEPEPGRRDVGPPTQVLRLRDDVRQASDVVDSMHQDSMHQDSMHQEDEPAIDDDDAYLTELRKAMISDNSPTTREDDGWRGRGPSGPPRAGKPGSSGRRRP